MNLIDLALGIVILLSIHAGWRRGFLASGADLAALVASLIVALALYPHVASFAQQRGLALGVWAPPTAFLVVYLIGRIMLGSVVSALLALAPAAVHTNMANRALGVVPGAGNGLINATIVAMLFLTVPLADAVSHQARESALANRFAALAEWLESQLGPIFNPAISQTMNRLTVAPQSTDTVALPYTVKNPAHRPDLEAAMLTLVNEARREQGLRPVQADPEAAEVARAHSRDMFARGYFSHLTPDGLDPFDRLRRGQVRFLAAGENLALARSLPMAHQGLMDSPGHRANILRPAFGRVGIGIVDGGRYGLMVTQMFRN